MSRLRGVPLRVTLVVTVVALAALGLLVAGVATTASLRSYLLHRVDDQLAGAAVPISSGYDHDDSPFGKGPDGSQPHGQLPSQFYVVRFTAAGATDGVGSAPLYAQSPPKLPALTTERAEGLSSHAFTVSSVDGRAQWRVIVQVRPGGDGSVAVATSLADLQHTVTHLELVESGIGGGVLVIIALGGYLLIRRALRPLGAVEDTAAAIAAGDLTRRVPPAHPRTEVGRLSAALNGMLTQIETAFTGERESREQARASETRMRQFVADASHELRTPLTSIRGFAELHRMGAAADPSDVARLMSRIESEAARMGLLVEDLLLLARLDQQRPLEHLPVDLLAVAGDVVHDVGVVATGHHVELVADAPVPPVVVGDESRLRQVVMNLVTNAATHTPAGTTVIVRVRADLAAGRVVLDVADDGPGLAPDQVDRVFERFYRADASRSRASGGNGLGLSIVAGIVAAHGGTVAARNGDPSGAVFTVELPLRVEAGSER